MSAENRWQMRPSALSGHCFDVLMPGTQSVCGKATATTAEFITRGQCVFKCMSCDRKLKKREIKN